MAVMKNAIRRGSILRWLSMNALQSMPNKKLLLFFSSTHSVLIIMGAYVGENLTFNFEK